MKRLEFTDQKRADIFARDKAICAFSGKILWILHCGASYLWDMDWVDHILPAMKGGDNSITNGICASSLFNAKKRDNSHDNKYLFRDGKPTEYYLHSHGSLANERSGYLADMSEMTNNDWYLNRALSSLMITVEYLDNPYDTKGRKMTRDELWWSKSAFKKIETWRKKDGDIESVINRLSIHGLGEDQKLMLTIVHMQNPEEIVALAQKLLPYYMNSKIQLLAAIEGGKNDITTLQMPLRDKEVIQSLSGLAL